MVSKGKRQYLISLYVIPFLRHSKQLTGKHRGLTDQEYWEKAESNLTGETASWNSGTIPRVQDQLFVKEIATKGYYEGVKKLNHDDDIEISHTIIKLSPTAQFLTIHRNKERTTNVSKQKAI